VITCVLFVDFFEYYIYASCSALTLLVGQGIWPVKNLCQLSPKESVLEEQSWHGQLIQVYLKICQGIVVSQQFGHTDGGWCDALRLVFVAVSKFSPRQMNFCTTKGQQKPQVSKVNPTFV